MLFDGVDRLANLSNRLHEMTPDSLDAVHDGLFDRVKRLFQRLKYRLQLLCKCMTCRLDLVPILPDKNASRHDSSEHTDNCKARHVHKCEQSLTHSEHLPELAHDSDDFANAYGQLSEDQKSRTNGCRQECKFDELLFLRIVHAVQLVDNALNFFNERRENFRDRFAH